MPDIIESKKPYAPPVSESLPRKKCSRCGKSCQTVNFYVNRGFEDKLDRWCKSCVSKCKTKDDVMEYFWENNREWHEEMWEKVQHDVEIKLNATAAYRGETALKKMRILDQATAQSVPQYMNNFYGYYNRESSGFATYADYRGISEPEASESPEPTKTKGDKKIWRDKYNGRYTDHEFEYLESYYNGNDGDSLELFSDRDSLKKIAKQALQVDKVQADFNAGRCDFSVVKDATSVLDMMLKSSNIAACKRKEKVETEMPSWGEYWNAVESLGQTYEPIVTWEPDDVDKVISHFRHIATALGLDGE